LVDQIRHAIYLNLLPTKDTKWWKNNENWW